MKTFVFTLCLLTAWAAHAQQRGYEFGFGYANMQPQHNMGNYIRSGHGFNMDYYFLPAMSKFAIGADFNYSIYGRDKSRQMYTFDDGSTADMDIIVHNSFSNFMLAGRYYLNNSGPLQPYLSAKAGYSWFRTTLNVYDPTDWDHCEPIDTELLMKDNTPLSSFGAGIQWDMSSIFKSVAANSIFFHANANMLFGGNVRYMNARAPIGHHHNNNSGNEISARFLNNQTQVVHEHHVGYVYNSVVNMLDIKVGMTFRYAGR